MFLAVNPIANGTSFNTQPGAVVCTGKEFPGENLFEGNKSEECRGILPGYREIAPGEKCLDTYADHKCVCVAVMIGLPG